MFGNWFEGRIVSREFLGLQYAPRAYKLKIF